MRVDDLYFLPTVRHFLVVGYYMRMAKAPSPVTGYILPLALKDLSTQSSLENFDKFVCAMIWLFAESYINLI